MLFSVRITSIRCFRRPLFATSHRYCTKLTLSSLSECKVLNSVEEDSDDDFLPWLESKADVEISSVLQIGKSACGRSLFASKKIRAGDCILQVPYSVQIAPDNLLPAIKSFIGDEISNVARLATVILYEQKMGQDSEWAPYISRLPQPGQMHNTIFWSEDELDMIRESSLYQETINKKVKIEKQFLMIKAALQRFHEFFDPVKLKDFMHAYALALEVSPDLYGLNVPVESRAWISTKGVTLIPFADFLNHDGLSEAIVVVDEDKQLSEVIADRDYASSEEVLIRYGKFSNATLLLDFGFTFPHNIHDEVHIHIKMPDNDPLRRMKLELLQRHCLPSIKDNNDLKSYKDSFTIKEVRSARGKGKGLPQSLRAFARVLCCTSSEELHDLAIEAKQNDGRLARRPFEKNSQEILAHQMLLSQITQLTEAYNASLESLAPVNYPPTCERLALRKQMARDLLIGELRVLQSASVWLENYCAILRSRIHLC